MLRLFTLKKNNAQSFLKLYRQAVVFCKLILDYISIYKKKSCEGHMRFIEFFKFLLDMVVGMLYSNRQVCESLGFCGRLK